jgi:hypothetical protein
MRPQAEEVRQRQAADGEGTGLEEVAAGQAVTEAALRSEEGMALRSW